MRRNSKKQTAVIASVVLGLISIMIMGALKKTLNRIPFFNKFMQLKNLGLDSMKDFLELSELNLRTESPDTIADVAHEEEPINPEEGHLVVWDSDGSSEYTLFIASEYLGKFRLLYADTIPFLREDEIPDLRESTNWMRKITVTKEDANEKISRGHQTNYERNDDRNKLRCSYPIPFEQFNCRIRSSNGRVSRHLQYPNFENQKVPEREVDAWLVQEGDGYYFYLKEPKETKERSKKRIYEYQIVLYVGDGKGLVRTVPPFKDFIKVELGKVEPGLCYLTGIRAIGTSFEQFVGWIGERRSLQMDNVLKPWTDMSHEEISKLRFE